MVKSPKKSVTKKQCEDENKVFRKSYDYVRNGKNIYVNASCINKKGKKSKTPVKSKIPMKSKTPVKSKSPVKYLSRSFNNPILSKYDEEPIDNFEQYIQPENEVDTNITNNVDKKTTAFYKKIYEQDINNPKNPKNITILYNYYNRVLDRVQEFTNIVNIHKNNNQLFPISGIYKINKELKEKFLKDVNKYYGKQVSETLRLLIDMTTYVTFDEFYDSLKKCIDIFLDKIGNNSYVMLYLGREDKSNFWVTELALDYIINNYPEKMPADILRNYKDIEYLFREEAGDVKYVAFDDCSYSGLQLSDHIEKELTDNPNRDNFYVIVPYISNSAYKLILDMNGIEYTTNNVIFNNKILKISEILNINGYDDKFIYDFIQNLLIYVNDFEIGPDKGSAEYEDEDFNANIDNVPIYFDHKIADSVSTYPKIYSFGIIYDKDKHVYIYDWLIKKCINSLNECPPKIYKNREKYIDFDNLKKFFFND